MPSTAPIEVNLADPAEVRAKLPEIKKLLEEQRKLRDEIDELIAFLARVVDEPAAGKGPNAYTVSQRAKGPRPRTHSSPAQDRAIKALEQAARPMGPKALFDYMQAEDMVAPANANALGANLWAAEKAGRIKKSGGKYLPLAYPITDYAHAGELGFSVPNHLPPDDGDLVP